MDTQQFTALKIGDAIRNKDTRMRHWITATYHEYVTINACNENYGQLRGVRLADASKWDKE